MKYIRVIIGDRVGLYLELDMELVGQSKRGSGCICPACVDYRPFVALDPRSSHRYIVPSTYWLMGAGRIVALLSWVLALSGSTVRGGF
jgi:hypothetical protein